MRFARIDKTTEVQLLKHLGVKSGNGILDWIDRSYDLEIPLEYANATETLS